MSRIAGLFTGAHGADAKSATAAMLARFDGTVTVAAGAQGAIGRAALPGGSIGGGVADEAGTMLALDGRILDRAGTTGGETGADAAILAKSFRRHEPVRTLADVSGDVSFGAIDAPSNRLYLCRDRFGVKPLYWAKTALGIAFASQPRALLTMPGVSREPSHGFVARFAGSHYRTFDNDPAESPFAAIHQVPHATILEFRDATAAPIAHRYWTLDDHGDLDGPEEELAERYRAELLRAIGQRAKRAHKPLFTLSGGLDSSTVLSTAAFLSGDKQDAISSVYTDATFDERDEIRDVVDVHVAHWHAVEIGDRIDVADIVAKQVRIHDEPVATATWLSHFILCEHAAGAGAGALFGGLGGDELNAGEYEYFPMHFADLAAAGRNGDLAHEIACWAQHHDHPVHRKDAAVAREMIATLTDENVPGSIRPDLRRMMRYRDTLALDYAADLQRFVPVMDRYSTSYLKNRAYQDLFRETLPCCLRAQDRQCTAFGIESTAPFLDHALVQFMFDVGGSHKIRDGVTKRLLRVATRGILPDATRTRVKKTGWNAPAHVWFSARTLEHLRDRVRSQAFRTRGIYDPDMVMGIIDDHVDIVATGAVRDNHMMFLWQLLNLEIWLDALPEISGKRQPSQQVAGR